MRSEIKSAELLNQVTCLAKKESKKYTNRWPQNTGKKHMYGLNKHFEREQITQIQEY